MEKRSNFSSFPQYLLHVFKQGPKFHFEISEVDITRVNCLYEDSTKSFKSFWSYAPDKRVDGGDHYHIPFALGEGYKSALTDFKSAQEEALKSLSWP